MQYLQYFENYDEEGLIKRFYENALHHDDINALNKVSNKYNVNPLDYIKIEEIIQYNAGNIFEYLFNDLEIDFNNGYLDEHIIKKGKFKIVKILYNNGYFDGFIDNKEVIDVFNVINNMKINTLEGIEIFQNLTTLVIVGHNIETLEPLRNLTQLELLNCNNNYIQSLEPLRNLTKLEKLNFENNQIQSLKPIEHLLPQLEFFNYINNPLDQESQELLKKYNLE